MTVDEFLVWAEAQPGRHELVDGHVVAMSPEKNIHARMKHVIVRSLEDSIEGKGLPCLAWPDGATVRIDDETAYEPDASVTCGDEAKANESAVPEPIIVVEVLSPNTQSVDAGAKLDGYFSLSAMRHYLMFHTSKQTVVHHQRTAGADIQTRIITEGTINLSPPGISIDIDQIYRDARKGLAA